MTSKYYIEALNSNGKELFENSPSLYAETKGLFDH